MAMSFGSYAGRVVATKLVATDGTGDFTDIQSAIDDLPSPGGGVVYIREGTYSITTGIIISNDNVALKGAGAATIITFVDSMQAITITGDYGLVENIQFQHTGSDAGGTEINAVRLNGSSNSIISNCLFTSIFNAIQLRGGSYYNSITNNKISGSGTAVWIQSEQNNIVYGNSISSCNSFGLRNNSSNNLFVNNVINGTSGSAIRSSNADNCVFTGNIISNFSVHGIYIESSSQYSIISGNFIHTCLSYGVYLSGAAGSDFAVINGNIIKSCNTGIYIETAGSNKNIVTCNQLAANTTPYIDNGTSTEIAHNITV